MLRMMLLWYKDDSHLFLQGEADMSLTPKDQDKPEDRSEIWRRGLLMLLLLICFGFGQSLLMFIAVAQFIWLAVNQQRNELLVRFGRSLACWLSDAGLFLCCATEDKPFPWAPWPNS
jgi:hypothetical protein